MICQETRDLINAYVDGELDLVGNLEIEQHLQECSACSQIYRNQQALRAAISGGSLYYRSPANLQKRIQSAVRKSSKSGPAHRTVAWPWAAIAAALVVVIVTAFGLARLQSTPSATPLVTDDPLTQEVIASHVRSLMANHLTDVPSSDQHTVKPWFNGKLDFSPQVEDLAGQGFPLVGGRLDYIDNRPVAALIYGRNKHYINLFIWPVTGERDMATTTATHRGYHVFHWTRSGMTYWAVSDVNSSDLEEFVQLVQGRDTRTASP